MTIICIGEALIELSRAADGRFQLDCGGDAFTTAIYIARAGHKVAFATALGDDPYSDSVVDLAVAEGISSKYVARVPGRLPGVRIVDQDAGGRRTFDWRDAAPVRELFELETWASLAEGIMSARMVYLSGITLSLFSNTGIGRLLAVLEMARKNAVQVALDANFRPHGWKGDLGRARAVLIEALKRTDIALPAYDDEAVLWGDPSPEATVERLQAFGIGEIVVKNGPNSVLVAVENSREMIPVPELVVPVGATGAGDGFNAAYLSARIAGTPPSAASVAGHKLAAMVLRHPGPILPRTGAAVH